MKLNYRGISYDSQPATLEVTEGEVMGKFRGRTWKSHSVRGTVLQTKKARMTYRGVPC